MLNQFKWLGLFLCLIICNAPGSPYPPHQQWLQVESELARVIFKPGLEAEAQRVANLFDHYFPKLEHTLPAENKPDKFPIILANTAHEANGFVTLAPFHSVYFNRPSVFSGLEWYEALAIHETKHAIQFMNFRDNFIGNGLYILLGDIGRGVYGFLLNPVWYFEGDAVLEETLLSDGGRGRSASFELWYRTQELSNQRYRYYRAFLGTGYEDYPFNNFYALGYFLNSYMRKTYGDGVFDRINDDTGNLTLTDGFTFSSSVDNLTGNRLTGYYHVVMDDIRQKWQQQYDSTSFTEVNRVYQPQRNNWNSYYPIHANEESIYAVRVDFHDGFWLVKITGDKETKLTRLPSEAVRGFYSASKERTVSMGGDQACWLERQTHKRFAFESWSRVACFDVKTGLHKTIKKNTKFTSIAVSSGGHQIAAVEFSEKRKTSLVIIDMDGTELDRKPLRDLDFPFDLSWHTQNRGIVFGNLNQQGFSIQNWTLSENQINTLVPESHLGSLRSPIILEQALYYSDDYSGVDNIWRMDLQSQDIQQITRRPFGAYFPIAGSSEQNQLLFSDYTSQGHNLVSISLDKQQDWLPKESVKNDKTYYFEPILEARKNDPVTQPGRPEQQKEYPIRPYNRASNLILPNNWGFGLGSETSSIYINSTNLLQTLNVTAGYVRHNKEEENSGLIDIAYSRYTPILGLSAATSYIDAENNFTSVETNNDEAWRDQIINLYTTLPFNQKDGVRLNSSAFTFGFQNLERETLEGFIETDPEEFPMDTNLNSAFVEFSLSSLRENAFLTQAPVVGYVSKLHLQQSLEFEEENAEKQLGYLDSDFLISGLFKGQGLQVKAYMESQAGDNFYLQPTLYQARGYSEPLIRERLALINTDYKIPLGPLDMNIINFMYFKSATLILSADYEYAEWETESFDRGSVGIGLETPFNIFSNYHAVINTRSSMYYLEEEDKTQFKIELYANY